MVEKRNEHIPSGMSLTLGHVLVAAELQADQGIMIGFSVISDVDSRSRRDLETAVLSWAKEREYDVADLVTWMDTEQAQHFVDYGRIRNNSLYGDRGSDFFPSVDDLRSDADKWTYGWESVADGESYRLVKRGGTGRYMLGHYFEFCAQRCYSNVDAPVPRMRQDWKDVVMTAEHEAHSQNAEDVSDTPPAQSFASIIEDTRKLIPFIHPHLAGERARAAILMAGFGEQIADEAYIRAQGIEIWLIETFTRLYDKVGQARAEQIIEQVRDERVEEIAMSLFPAEGGT